MYRGFVLAAADPGSTPSMGPFVTVSLPLSLILFPVKLFSYSINKVKRPKKYLKKKKHILTLELNLSMQAFKQTEKQAAFREDCNLLRIKFSLF